MHSRLYTRVLNYYPWMANCTANSSLYNETGLFSISATCDSAKAEDMVNVLCKEFQVRHATRGTPPPLSPCRMQGRQLHGCQSPLRTT